LAVKRRRRAQLEALIGEPLPTPEEELREPELSDDRYAAATRALIGRRHNDSSRHAMLHAENTGYGFRRNLLALKSVGVAIVVFSLCVDVWVLLSNQFDWRLAAVSGIHIAALLTWVLAVKSEWVLEAAEDYASTLFETLEGFDQDRPE
jgi:hypothetical protein